MQWRCLSEAELSALYDTDLCRDFPAGELRPRAAALALMRRGVYHVWGIFDPAGGTPRLAAYLLMASPLAEGPLLLDYFAVLPAWRCRGLGAALLAELSRREARSVVIESELPETAPDPALARRRLAFYRRCGALDTPLWDRVYDGRYRVLVLPAPGQTDAVLDARTLAAMYRILLPGEEYVKFFEFGPAAPSV